MQNGIKQAADKVKKGLQHCKPFYEAFGGIGALEYPDITSHSVNLTGHYSHYYSHNETAHLEQYAEILIAQYTMTHFGMSLLGCQA